MKLNKGGLSRNDRKWWVSCFEGRDKCGKWDSLAEMSYPIPTTCQEASGTLAGLTQPERGISPNPNLWLKSDSLLLHSVSWIPSYPFHENKLRSSLQDTWVLKGPSNDFVYELLESLFSILRFFEKQYYFILLSLFFVPDPVVGTRSTKIGRSSCFWAGPAE